MHGESSNMVFEALQDAEKDRIRNAADVLADALGMTREDFADQLAGKEAAMTAEVAARLVGLEAPE